MSIVTIKLHLIKSVLWIWLNLYVYLCESNQYCKTYFCSALLTSRIKEKVRLLIARAKELMDTRKSLMKSVVLHLTSVHHQ